MSAPVEVEAARLRVVERARALVAAANACEVEVERHPSSRSSAPLVRYIGAMTALREALEVLDVVSSPSQRSPVRGATP